MAVRSREPVQEPTALDADAYRGLMRAWPSGVAVVAASAGGRLEGCTVSAFTSVAAEPPLVLICLDDRSRTCAAVVAGRRFSVNVLGSTQAWLADRFSRKGAEDRFGGVQYRLELGVPLIAGAICQLICDVADVTTGGDHAIVLGAPIGGAAAGGTPLLYVDRTYRRPGEAVEAHSDATARRAVARLSLARRTH